MIQPKLDYYDIGHGVVAFSSTRNGGCSKGSYAEFNINCYCGDDEADVSTNREALCRLLGIGGDRLLMPHQVHQTKVARVDEQLLARPEEERRQQLDGYDALMTDVAGVCIGVSTADCIPLLLFDGEHHAVCAIHAGWRGTVARIVERSVAAMTAAYGTRPSQLRSQIGPGISLGSFEVGDEVYAAFSAAGFDMGAISRREAKWHIDLPECNRQQLVASGVPAQAIQVSGVCTYLQPDRYFSARRLGIHSGRIFTGIMLRQ
ncbi:MAG: peptidoglycan editing factor PgeF [Prevotella sp.]|nr:peptidoglycan editing factor PgeF [Prevotella sp.]